VLNTQMALERSMPLNAFKLELELELKLKLKLKLKVLMLDGIRGLSSIPTAIRVS
jgi:hypothetical protein